MKELICLSMFIILSALFCAAMIIAGFVCQYKKNSQIKDETYECGISNISSSRIRFDIKYFNYAIVFLIFDIETIFLYPFALFINQLGIFTIIEAFIFITILLIGLIFAINKKLLRWI